MPWVREDIVFSLILMVRGEAVSTSLFHIRYILTVCIKNRPLSHGTETKLSL